MLDIKFIRENPDAVKENIKKKFQDAKLPLVDEVIEVDAKYRADLKEAETLRAERNTLSKSIGMLMGAVKKASDEAAKAGFLASIPARRAATPDEIAQTVVFLASDAARYLTGQSVTVDGGYTAQ